MSKCPCSCGSLDSISYEIGYLCPSCINSHIDALTTKLAEAVARADELQKIIDEANNRPDAITLREMMDLVAVTTNERNIARARLAEAEAALEKERERAEERRMKVCELECQLAAAVARAERARKYLNDWAQTDPNPNWARGDLIAILSGIPQRTGQPHD